MNRLINSFWTRISKPTAAIQFNIDKIRSFCKGIKVTEDEIRILLKKKYPQAKTILVEDTSSGCGAMFNIFVETGEFKGLSVAKQHRSVYETLDEQIKNIHGLHLETKVVK